MKQSLKTGDISVIQCREQVAQSDFVHYVAFKRLYDVCMWQYTIYVAK